MQDPLQDPMQDPEHVRLSPQEMETLIYVIDGSLQVDLRFRFFLWAQGGLQSLLPHETMICAWGDIDGMRFRYEVFSRMVLDDGFTGGLADPIDGLLPRLIEVWCNNEKRLTACTTCAAGHADSPLPPRLYGALQRQGIERIVMHGTRKMQDETGSFFVFLNGAENFGARDTYLTELLLPHLHLAVHRLPDDETAGGQPPSAEVRIDAVLSGREAQVLQWVREGKTNQEIAQILDISPLTVKNHVQKILRKLNVTNRTQAVARGIAARLIPGHEAR